MAFATTLVGGCVINGHYKVEALRVIDPEKYELKIGPGIAQWGVVQRSDGVEHNGIIK